VVITRGTDAHGHLPAAIAGNIYRALSPRFGTQINFQVAQGADDGEEVNPRDKKAAALNEEAAETKAATEAEENGDQAVEPANSAGNNPNTNNTAGAEPKSKVKTTVMPIDSKPKTPAKTAAPSKPKANDTNDGRPRRSQPDQQ
jgi:hypothetical protein